MDEIALHYTRICAEIHALSQQAGQESPVLVAVSKTFPASAVLEAYGAGCRDFGENRLPEFLQKVRELPRDIRWHFVGQLQSRKARDVVGKAHLIHSLDRLSLAEAVEKQAASLKLVQGCLVQVNIGDEPQKGGVKPADLSGFIGQLRSFPHVEVRGLMCIPPASEDATLYFRQMRQLRQRMQEEFPGLGGELSMGMSDDYSLAVREGSTLVRIGSAIFGQRG
ncbi:alanine racemase domain protein [Desulfurispirillum indicum S5]|uniref:Pyridoxal phosphate homeostasis protein n=1 Tax=Desulfurispirillum indicum (strain ATCC BAA-1389 / DSM 22839 / S5) TaxID=653733 RepID=E6W5G9_DESIS|nr:YggS family pyridoxal phosphate-dependent enzyme [Desulfurispirillum indicum]ADU64900.1 alanine racemase domain protein [Desulfurispirillum indicum S5]